MGPSTPAVLNVSEAASLVPCSPSVVIRVKDVRRSSLVVTSRVLFASVTVPWWMTPFL